MKEIKELKFEELTLEQKIGMVMVASVRSKESFEYALELLKKRSIGAIWIYPQWDYNREEAKKAFEEAADYPVILIADAESGMGDHLIGRHNALGLCGSEELAYTFGKITAIEARKHNINVVCNPLLDMTHKSCSCGTNNRAYGGDKETVARLAAAEARGLHDGGVLTVGKHYPGSSTTEHIDSHMAETSSDATVEDLLNYNLYPYKYLIDRGLLDGVMTKHTRYSKIDDKYPASLSKKVIDIIRERLGFDGFCVTDALTMMGIVTKFGKVESRGMATAAGNDLALCFGNAKEDYETMCECYRKGVFTDEQLDRAVKKVLEIQHRTTLLPKDAVITAEDEEKFARINKDCICAKVDEGVSAGIDPNGKYLFAVLTPMNVKIDNGKAAEDTMTNNWYKPERILKHIAEKFPNSGTFAIKEYPEPHEVRQLLDAATEYDEVIFVTYFNSAAYVGREAFTPRILSIFDAMQMTNAISTVLYFGNPFVLEDIPHVKRILMGPTAEGAIDSAIEILAGEYPANGVMTYNVNFK